MTRVAIYTRLSTDEQEKGTSMEKQEQECREYALSVDERNKKEKWDIVEELVLHETTSGAKMDKENRPKWFQLMESASRREIDKILVYTQTRIYRPDNPKKNYMVEMLIDNLDQLGVEIVILDRKDENLGLMNSLVTSVHSTTAMTERVRIRTQADDGKVRTAIRDQKAPVNWGAYGVFGYDHISKQHYGSKHKDVGKLIINKEESKWVKKIFEMRASGMTFVDIADVLQDNNVITKSGKERWNPVVISHMIQNTTYKGETHFVITPFDYDSKKMRTKDITMTDLAPRIVTTTLWNKANSFHIKKGKTPKRIYMLTGHIFCKCESKMMGVVSGKKYLKYRCPNSYQTRYVRKDCDMKEVRMPVIHEGVRNALIDILSNKRILADALDNGYRTDLPKLEDKLKQLQKDIKQFKAKRKNLNDMRMAGDVDAKEYKRLAGLIARDESAYLSNMDDLRAQINSANNTSVVDIDATTQWIKDIRLMIKTADIDLMRHILSMLMLKVIVLDRLDDGTPIIKLEGIIPYRVDRSQNQIQIETSESVITTTTAQTSAYYCISSSNPFSNHYTNGTQSEIKLKEINNKMKDFNNQYGLYFNTNNLIMNNSRNLIKLQAYCRNGDNKLSAKKTYKLS